MTIANCAKCNKVFQKMDASPLCSACMDATKSHAEHVTDFVWSHPGLTLEEVAKQCGLSVKDMEEMLFSGRLGRASAHVMFKCQSCHLKMSAQLRKGRFCPECAAKIESKVNQLEREASLQKEKSHPAPKRVSDKKEDARNAPIEAAGAYLGDPTISEPQKPAIPETKRPETPPKQESVSPALDSYGFKRVSDI